MSILPLSDERLAKAYALHQAAHPNPWSFSTFADCQTSPYTGYVLVDNAITLGYAVLLMVVDEATLMDIAVDDAVRGNGHGNTLMKHIINECEQASMASLWLEVRAGNVAAVSLYNKYGFEIIETRKGYYTHAQTGEKEDAIIMRLLFT